MTERAVGMLFRRMPTSGSRQVLAGYLSHRKRAAARLLECATSGDATVSTIICRAFLREP